MKTPTQLVAAAKARVAEVPLAEAEEALRAADAVVDVREADEFAAGHIPGAVHMSRGTLEFRIANTPALQSPDARILLYCKTSGRASLCAVALQDMGYRDVRSIAGGFEAWVAAGKAVVSA